jgi:hypothetical protein
MLIVATSADIPLMKEMRDSEYLESVSWLKKNTTDQEKVIFLESVINESSFIEKYYSVYYSKTHNPDYQNIGANLGNSMKKLFEIFHTDEDLICQMTGRYHLKDRYFFDTILQNPGYDFYGKDVGGQYFTGCFVLKKDYLIDWLNTTDWDQLNYRMINIEKCLYDYVKTNNLKAYEIDSIHMKCNVFGKGNPCMIEV